VHVGDDLRLNHGRRSPAAPALSPRAVSGARHRYEIVKNDPQGCRKPCESRWGYVYVPGGGQGTSGLAISQW